MIIVIKDIKTREILYKTESNIIPIIGDYMVFDSKNFKVVNRIINYDENRIHLYVERIMLNC